jgi:cation:H+ antiporter
MLIGGAELFVSSIEQLSHGLGVDPLILTLVIAPLATELPETLNSVIWVRQGKDTLALGNITGALVLQSMPLVAFGMVFTSWRLTSPALAAMLAALAGAALSLIAVLRPRGWSAPFVGCSAGLYLGGITAIIAVTLPGQPWRTRYLRRARTIITMMTMTTTVPIPIYMGNSPHFTVEDSP